VVVRDARGDVGAAPDITRLAVSRGADGRVRVALTLASTFSPGSLVARSGPPGSICLRVWTASVPPNTRPDYLACVTTEANRRTLRGTVMQDRPGPLPRRVASAAVSRRGRSLVIRFSQSAVGRPSLMRFAAEATRAGCVRASCVDTAPDAPKISRVRLRKATARAPT
jgi:hypothetical protein